MKIKSLYLYIYLIGLLLITSCGNKKEKEQLQQQQQQQVKEYAVDEVRTTNTVLKTSYPATLRGINDVEIRPKINGFITKKLVEEGSVVKKGQLLFQLDRVQYEEAVTAAQAAVRVAETQVATSQLNVDTRAELQRQNIISEYELQTVRNQLASSQATLAQAKAQLTSARNDLSYTNITSPTDGVVGNVPYDVGSLVSASSEPPLTVVSDISNMKAFFSMDEKQYLSLIKDGGRLQDLIKNMPEVELQLADGTTYPQKGRIETLTGVIDQTTGTATLKAVFSNKNNVLRSGGTANVLIPNYLNSVILIPQKATYELQDRKFVYVLTDSSTVKSTPIQILPQDDGKNYIVTDGLQAGQKIVVEGVISLKDGMKIKPITPQQAEELVKKQTQPGRNSTTQQNTPVTQNEENNETR